MSDNEKIKESNYNYRKDVETENNETDNENIVVQLLHIRGKAEKFDDVAYIKITSKKYNLIIMKDYVPIIGEVEGKIEIGRKNDILKLEDVRGYFMHKHNTFNLFF